MRRRKVSEPERRAEPQFGPRDPAPRQNDAVAPRDPSGLTRALTASVPEHRAATAYFCRGAVSRRASRGHQARRLDSRPMTQADLTRERLVRAALELFTAQGYHDTTTPAIAKKAGVAEGTIYRHFAGKQQFFNELYRASARWAGKLVKDADALNVGPREKLAELARGLFAGAAREPAVARLFFVHLYDDLLGLESRQSASAFSLVFVRLI